MDRIETIGENTGNEDCWMIIGVRVAFMMALAFFSRRSSFPCKPMLRFLYEYRRTTPGRYPVVSKIDRASATLMIVDELIDVRWMQDQRMYDGLCIFYHNNFPVFERFLAQKEQMNALLV